MRSLAGSAVALVIGAFEVLDLGIRMADVEPHLMTAIGAVEKFKEHTLFSVFLVRSSPLCRNGQLLHLLENVTGDYRIVDVLKDLPIRRIVRDPFLVLEGLGVGFEVDHVSAVFLLSKDLGDGILAPFEGIDLRFLSSA